MKALNEVVTYVRNSVEVPALVLGTAVQPTGTFHEVQEGDVITKKADTEEHLTLVYLDPALLSPVMSSTQAAKATATAIGIGPLKPGGTNGWKESSATFKVAGANARIKELDKEVADLKAQLARKAPKDPKPAAN